ncbi:MAG: O-antigen ligase family protein [Blastocatellales bacterium]
MEIDFRQVVLLAVALTVPVALLWTKRERLLLGWVCATMFVQIFDTAIITNLPAGRIVGLIYMPVAAAQARAWLKLRPVRVWTLNLVYLLILGLLFGWLWPWPDLTMARPFTLTAEGRSIIYSARLLSDISLAVFIANQLRQPGVIYYIGRAMVIGTTLTALAGLVYLATKLDLYYPLTGIGEQASLIARARGLSIEPRALGLGCAYGIMILLLGRKSLFSSWPLLLLINLIALLITYSASSFVLLFAGAVTAWLFFSNRERGMVIATLALAVVITAGAVVYLPQRVQYAADTLQFRLDPDYKLSGIPPGNFGQEIAYRLDVFDASALLFLLDQPLYALIGTGPGLVSLPASYYVPPGLYSFIWTAEIGINSLPFHGLLLEVSNGGLLGLMLWLVQVFSCWGALRYLHTRFGSSSAEAEWTFAYAIFIIGAVFYVVQVSSSPVWSVFLGIGWVATKTAAEKLNEERVAQAKEYFMRTAWNPRAARPE